MPFGLLYGILEPGRQLQQKALGSWRIPVVPFFEIL
jgi:hypothetical protein